VADSRLSGAAAGRGGQAHQRVWLPDPCARRGQWARTATDASGIDRTSNRDRTGGHCGRSAHVQKSTRLCCLAGDHPSTALERGKERLDLVPKKLGSLELD